MGLTSSFDRIGITDNPNPRTDQTTFQSGLSSEFFITEMLQVISA